MAEKLDLDALDDIESLPVGETPRVHACITAVMKQFPSYSPSSQARYYEEVHQHLAPLARTLERELSEALSRIRELERASQPGSDFDPIAGADSQTTVDLPCPFCGGEGYLMKDGPHHWIECSQCFCETTRCQSPSGNDEAAARRAIQLWEQRYGRASQRGSGEAAQDASRYRWLRETAIRCQAYVRGKPNWLFGFELRGTTFDEAVDAARASLDGRREG